MLDLNTYTTLHSPKKETPHLFNLNFKELGRVFQRTPLLACAPSGNLKKKGQFPDILLNFGGQEEPKLVYWCSLLACSTWILKNWGGYSNKPHCFPMHHLVILKLANESEEFLYFWRVYLVNWDNSLIFCSTLVDRKNLNRYTPFFMLACVVSHL